MLSEDVVLLRRIFCPKIVEINGYWKKNHTNNFTMTILRQTLIV
jgi:hypothetical protein